MTPQEAYEIAMKALEVFPYRDHHGVQVTAKQRREAWTVLRAHHAYFSRFKPGDECHPIVNWNDAWQSYMALKVLRVEFWYDATMSPLVLIDDRGQTYSGFPQSNCFPTSAEAEAEAERRNRDA